jgi:hypothetical protein
MAASKPGPVIVQVQHIASFGAAAYGPASRRLGFGAGNGAKMHPSCQEGSDPDGCG